MRRLILLAGLALAGCTRVIPAPCPVLVPYTRSDQAALAAELRTHPQPETARWIGDYVGLRDQVRACPGGAGPLGPLNRLRPYSTADLE